MRIDELADYGIDVKMGIERCANDEGIYYRLLAAFLRDTSMTKAQKAYGNGDYGAMFAAMHELKGSCGNAAMNELYKLTSALVETLRKGNFTESDVDGQFRSVCAAYDKAKDGVSRLLFNK